jgi:hypothetical protein
MKDIIWDIDGVLSDFTLGFKQFVRRFHEIPLAPCGAKKTWQFSGLSQAEEGAIWGRIAKGEYDWSMQGSLLTAGDWHGIRDLHAAGAEFQYITSRLGPVAQVEAQTIQWLHGQGFPDEGNVHVSDSKVKTINELGFEPLALIDDDIRNIVQYTLFFGDDKTYIRDWQYNRAGEVAHVYGEHTHGQDPLLACPDHPLEATVARHCKRVSSISEFCYSVLEGIDGVDRG